MPLGPYASMPLCVYVYFYVMCVKG